MTRASSSTTMARACLMTFSDVGAIHVIRGQIQRTPLLGEDPQHARDLRAQASTRKSTEVNVSVRRVAGSVSVRSRGDAHVVSPTCTTSPTVTAHTLLRTGAEAVRLGRDEQLVGRSRSGQGLLSTDKCPWSDLRGSNAWLFITPPSTSIRGAQLVGTVTRRVSAGTGCRSPPSRARPRAQAFQPTRQCLHPVAS
jgi:hypothetical protein